MLAIVDLGISNLGSVIRACERLGAMLNITRLPAGLEEADGVVLPGVGTFGDGMASLREAGLVEPFRRVAREGKPILGICLGMQLLADQSEEYGHHQGLGLLSGRVRRLVPGHGDRIPNIGWCDVRPCRGARLFRELDEGESFYFLHSYHLVVDRPELVAAQMPFGDTLVTAAVEHGNVFGVQFHPEKSQDAGLSVLNAFIRLSGEAHPVNPTSESRE